MHTRYRTRSVGARRTHRVLRPVAGQCFEIVLTQDVNGWVIRIPEIDQITEATHRAAVELAARECIAGHTGIPMGYISVWVRD